MAANKVNTTLTARQMVAENAKRGKALFTRYNPSTGEGAPGQRVKVSLSDLCIGAGRTLYLPAEMAEKPFIHELAKAGSVENFCVKRFARYDAGLRETVVRLFLKTWAKYDFYFFCYAYARIKNKEGGEDFPFVLRPAQVKLAETFEQQRLQNKPIRVILLKARQWGGSTCTQIYMAWIQIMWVKAWNSIIVGHQGDSAAEVKDMYVKLINALPDFLFYEEGKPYDNSQPHIKGGGTTNISIIPLRNCKIKTATALNPEGARGGDSAMAHCTEVAFWPKTEKMDPQRQVKSSCSGILYKPFTIIVYESTANGQNFFYDEWNRASEKDEYGEKVSAFIPLFVAWWEIEEYTAVPPNMTEWAKTLIDRREDKKNNWDYLYWLWTIGATLEGIYWYSHKMKEYASMRDMQQEYPSDSVEAFKYSGEQEFDPYCIEQMRKFCKVPLFEGDIYGAETRGEKAVANLHLVPRTAGCMKIWEHPDKSWRLNNRYFVSVDIGGSHKTSDYSVITVFDRSDMMDEDGARNEYAGPRVVAEWVGHTDADLLAIKCAQISRFYENALLIVENNTAYSKMNDTDKDNVSELFFPILLPIYNNIYSKNKSSLDRGENKPEKKWGFNTNGSTKPSMIKYMAACIRDKTYIERSIDTIHEMSWFMKFPNNKYGALPGKHDDRVMSRAIGLFVSFDEWDRYPVSPMPTEKEREQSRATLSRASIGIERILD